MFFLNFTISFKKIWEKTWYVWENHFLLYNKGLLYKFYFLEILSNLPESHGSVREYFWLIEFLVQNFSKNNLESHGNSSLFQIFLKHLCLFLPSGSLIIDLAYKQILYLFFLFLRLLRLFNRLLFLFLLFFPRLFWLFHFFFRWLLFFGFLFLGLFLLWWLLLGILLGSHRCFETYLLFI